MIKKIFVNLTMFFSQWFLNVWPQHIGKAKLLILFIFINFIVAVTECQIEGGTKYQSSGGTGANPLKSEGKQNTPQPLTNNEQKILNYLKRDWKKTFRTTNIEQAMNALGMPFDDQTRRNIGNFLRQAAKDPTFAKKNARIQKWGWITFTLTNNEKLLGRYIAFKESKGEPITSVNEIGEKLRMSDNEIKQGLRMLGDISLMVEDMASPIGYRLSANSGKLINPRVITLSSCGDVKNYGRLGFTYHAVRVNNGPEFNVQCFLDYKLLSRGSKKYGPGYKNEVVSLRDTCLHCIEPITITFDKGKMVKLEPKTAVEVTGKGCGGKNAFLSMSHYNEWKKQNSDFEGTIIELKKYLIE